MAVRLEQKSRHICSVSALLRVVSAHVPSFSVSSASAGAFPRVGGLMGEVLRRGRCFPCRALMAGAGPGALLPDPRLVSLRRRNSGKAEEPVTEPPRLRPFAAVTVRPVGPVLSDELGGRQADLLAEDRGEIRGTAEVQLHGDPCYGGSAVGQQQALGPLDPVVQQVVGGGEAGFLPERAPEAAGAQADPAGDVVDARRELFGAAEDFRGQADRCGERPAHPDRAPRAPWSRIT